MTITAEKKSLLLYYDYAQHFNFLTDEQTGKIIKAMLDYEINGVFPEFSEPIMQMTFSFIRTNLDRDKEKWFETCKTNKKNGKLGGRPPKNQSGEQVDTTEEQEQNNTTNTEYSSQSQDDETAELKRNFISNFGNI